jgi:RHS repeat-associated protein
MGWSFIRDYDSGLRTESGSEYSTAAGRKNYIDYVYPTTNIGGIGNQSDRVTAWTYNGTDQIVTLTAYNGSSSADQVTKYLYEDTVSPVRVTNTIYPDSSDTTSSGTNQVKQTYNLDGSMATTTDQRGVVRTISYNSRRQLERDAATTIPSGVDDSVKSIKRTYDTLGRMEKVTSYSTTDDSGTVRNQVVLTYNTVGKVNKSEQSHEGVVVGGTTPDVEYTYDASVPSGEDEYDDGLRMDAVYYPLVPGSGGNVAMTSLFHSNAGLVDDYLNRIRYVKLHSGSTWAGGSATFTNYTFYNGTGRVAGIRTTNTTFQTAAEWVAGASGNYSAWDRFGRTLQRKWTDHGSAVKDQFDYTYDYAGNRLTRDIPSSLYSTNDRDQQYWYDGLQRLQKYHAGPLVSGSISEGSVEDRQQWYLDQLGNWSEYEEGFEDLYQIRTHNDANEIGTIGATSGDNWTDPIYDAAGNTTSMPHPKGLTATAEPTYDPWNRLMDVNDGELAVIYEYDGLNRMIVRIEYGVDYSHYYYNEGWQVLVEAEGTSTITPTAMYAYHPYYVDAVANRMRSSDSHVYVHDANFNVTALLTSSGSTATVKERYSYTPYGEVTILNGASDSDGSEWAVDTNGSDMQNEILYTGRWVDPNTGLQLNRNRWYHQQLGRLLSRDPIGYEGGSLNLYEYVDSGPINYDDPFGFQTYTPVEPAPGSESPPITADPGIWSVPGDPLPFDPTDPPPHPPAPGEGPEWNAPAPPPCPCPEGREACKDRCTKWGAACGAIVGVGAAGSGGLGAGLGLYCAYWVIDCINDCNERCKDNP